MLFTHLLNRICQSDDFLSSFDEFNVNFKMIYSPSKETPKSSQIREENMSNFEMKTCYSSQSKLNDDVKKKEISRKDGKFCL